MKPRLPLPSTETLRSMLSYNPATGALIWRPRAGATWSERTWNTRYAGKPAGTLVPPHGYYAVRIKGQRYWAHRVIWKLVHGEEPAVEIDHIDGNPSNNAMTNLRGATISQNRRNARRFKRHIASGEKGVRRYGRVWGAFVMADGRVHHVGAFDTIAEAKAARDAKARELHGEFFNPG